MSAHAVQGEPRQENSRAVDPAAAEEFLALYQAENPAVGPIGPRVEEVRAQIERYGTYAHTADELAFGARAAWRNSSRCIGRLYWRSLRVRDRRHVTDAGQVAAEAFAHLREATNHGRVRPTITVFAPGTPGRPGPRIWNEQLIRYAGYRRGDGTVVGDPRYADFTDTLRRLGWPGGPGTPFDVLPLVVKAPGDRPRLFNVPEDAVLEVPLRHPASSGSPTWGCAGTRSRPAPSGFLTHLAREERAGRITPADWSWIVPPVSGSATAVFHRYYDTADLRPNYVHHR